MINKSTTENLLHYDNSVWSNEPKADKIINKVFSVLYIADLLKE